MTINAVVDNMDEGIVTLDVEDYPAINLPVEMVPLGVHEGDCVKLMSVLAADDSLRITIKEDPAACKKRRKEMQRLRKELRSK